MSEQKTLRETILNMLDNEPYTSKKIIENNPLDDTVNDVKDIINNPLFDSIDKFVSPLYAKKIVHLLWEYYSNIYIAEDKENQPFKTQVSKEIDKDIKTIKKFIVMMEENFIYNNDLERNYTNKQDDKFVFDYCKNLINDLENKQFKKSYRYKSTKFKANKNNIKEFFEQIKKEYPQIKKHDVIKNFIDSI